MPQNSSIDSSHYGRHWPWVIGSYFAEGMPYAIINTLALTFLADMQVGNDQATRIVSAIAMAWALKALWSPVVEHWKSKRWWMHTLQLVMAAAFLLLAISLLTHSWWLGYAIVVFSIVAIASATYDIACDGFYMQVLPGEAQSYFVGVRNTAYRLSTVFVTGVLLALTGWFETLCDGAISKAWFCTFSVIALLMVIICIGLRIGLPRNEEPLLEEPKLLIQEFYATLRSFLAKGKMLLFMFAFLLLFRLGEALLSKVTVLFLKDSIVEGGLGLSNTQLGLIHGTIGVISLIVGGIIGGFYISRFSLRRSIIPMALMLNVPDLLYVWLASAQPSSLWVISGCVAVEQFGYGFGLTAYTVYMLQAAGGKHATSHYAIITALMAIGMNIPSFFSGELQMHLGYVDYFIVTCLSTLPGITLSIVMWKCPKLLFEKSN